MDFDEEQQDVIRSYDEAVGAMRQNVRAQITALAMVAEENAVLYRPIVQAVEQGPSPGRRAARLTVGGEGRGRGFHLVLVALLAVFAVVVVVVVVVVLIVLVVLVVVLLLELLVLLSSSSPSSPSSPSRRDQNGRN